jgi:hypothetical protein
MRSPAFTPPGGRPMLTDWRRALHCFCRPGDTGAGTRACVMPLTQTPAQQQPPVSYQKLCCGGEGRLCAAGGPPKLRRGHWISRGRGSPYPIPGQVLLWILDLQGEEARVSGDDGGELERDGREKIRRRRGTDRHLGTLNPRAAECKL